MEAKYERTNLHKPKQSDFEKQKFTFVGILSSHQALYDGADDGQDEKMARMSPLAPAAP